MTIYDPKTIAADLMTSHARDIDHIDVWAHIGQAYDVDVVEANIDASIASEVIDLIGKAGIDLIWPDGSTNTELEAARAEVERGEAELAAMTRERDAYRTERDNNLGEFFAITEPLKAQIAYYEGPAKQPGRLTLVSRAQRAPLYAAYRAAREWAEKNSESYTDDGIIQAAVKAYRVELIAQAQQAGEAAGGNRQQWAVAPEPNVAAVRDRFSRLWVRSEYETGPNLWWQDERGAGRPLTWHTLLGDCGPLTEAKAAEAVTA